MALRKDCVSFTRNGIREKPLRKHILQNPIVIFGQALEKLAVTLINIYIKITGNCHMAAVQSES